jgi:hypothetical protein
MDCAQLRATFSESVLEQAVSAVRPSSRRMLPWPAGSAVQFARAIHEAAVVAAARTLLLAPYLRFLIV